MEKTKQLIRKPKKQPSEALKDCLADALLILIQNKPIEKITIDELVQKAGVGRATYFRAFGSKPEAITYKFIRLWKGYCQTHPVEINDRFDLGNALAFFQYNYEIRDTLKIVYQAGLEQAVYESFHAIMLAQNQEAEPERLYREKFYAYGLYGLLDEWVRNEFEPTPEQMADLLVQIVNNPYLIERPGG